MRSAARGVAKAKQERKESTAPTERPARSDVGGRLPGDDSEDLYWEERIATWLGVARKRIVKLRRRGLREGEHWIVHAQGIVYTAAGLQKLRDYLGALGALNKSDVEPESAETPAPVGPPEKKTVVVARIYPNTRLMLAHAPESTEEKPVRVLVRVRDNRNFMPGMRVPVVHDERNESWQYVGRLPRRRGRL